MKGYPKYKLGDRVQFTLEDIGTLIGSIYIIDSYGTWDNDSDVSYDIMVDDFRGQECLFKHITESLVKEV